MFAWLRRHRPSNPWLAILYWAVVTLAALLGLFVIFYFLDDYLPGQGMF
ncbi:MAG TPA: hypothetical protein VG602_07105 [Actinomycetota bacterium]|nr:hypothetical protein [Actinomycetota bacterium]